jgi:periplasmic divalent cation tolerance protein
MTEFIVALTTCPTKIGEKLARTLVEERVCACVNIIPKITSIYHWKDKIVEDTESLLIMKTDVKHTRTLWEAIKKNHPYEVPEYVVIPIEWGSKDYLDWISQNVTVQ